MKIHAFILILLLPILACSQEVNDTCIQRIEKLKSTKLKAEAYDLAAENAWNRAEYDLAISYADKGLEICAKHNYPQLKAKLLTEKGIAYDYLGKYSLALQNFYKALRIQEKLNYPNYEAYILSNIGLIYENQHKYPKALEFHEKSLAIRRTLEGKTAVSASLNNIGNVYHAQNKFHQAIDKYLECIQIDSSLNDEYGLGDDFNNIANSYMGLKKFDLALEYYHKGLKIREKYKNPFLISQSISNIGTVYFNLKQYDKAKPYLLKGLAIADSISAKDLQCNMYDLLYTAEENQGNFPEAFQYYKKFIAYRDSLDNSEDARIQTELEMTYQFDKEKEREKLIQEKKDAQEKIILYGISGILLIIVFFSMLLFRRWKQTQLQKSIIEDKNKLVQLKNEEITDSINYAKRIQTAILPSEKVLNELLPNHYLIYLPKDIVAGDFYWLEEIEGTCFVAVADCTGHGVPGALMSVVCHNALNRSVREYNLKIPGEILDKTREIIVAELSKNTTVVYDGMDISLCAFKRNSNTIQWAGANNALWIYRKELKSIEEFKANKQPIGVHREYAPFSTHSIDIQSGDRIFLFTDGFADQFGGENEKKLKSTGLKEQLLFIQKLPLEERKNNLLTFFNDWKGELDQLDDVCLLGFSVA